MIHRDCGYSPSRIPDGKTSNAIAYYGAPCQRPKSQLSSSGNKSNAREAGPATTSCGLCGLEMCRLCSLECENCGVALCANQDCSTACFGDDKYSCDQEGCILCRECFVTHDVCSICFLPNPGQAGVEAAVSKSKKVQRLWDENASLFWNWCSDCMVKDITVQCSPHQPGSEHCALGSAPLCRGCSYTCPTCETTYCSTCWGQRDAFPKFPCISHRHCLDCPSKPTCCNVTPMSACGCGCGDYTPESLYWRNAQDKQTYTREFKRKWEIK